MVIAFTMNKATMKIGCRVRAWCTLDELKLRTSLMGERNRIFGIYLATGRILTTHQNLLSIRSKQGGGCWRVRAWDMKPCRNERGCKKNSVSQNLLHIVFLDLTLSSEVSGQSNSLRPGVFGLLGIFWMWQILV